ncbi:MAG: porin [Bacteroidota bacterium]
MKKILIANFILALFWTQELHGQTDTLSGGTGKFSARIFGDFKMGLSSSDATAFEISRVYLAYEHQITPSLSGEIKLDIGSPEDESQYSLIRRYAYFKTAALTYKNKGMTIWLGLFDMLQFKEQENLWDRRYIFKAYMDEYKFGPSADIGVGMSYRFSETISADFIMSNGEGYKMLQADRYYKYAAGITWKPGPMIFRAYYDLTGADIPQMNGAFFTALRLSRFCLAGEGVMQWNYRNYEGYQRYGYSAFSIYELSEKWELFARYDQVYSNILSEETRPWNLGQDGSAVIAGIEYSPKAFLRFALNYQDWFPYAANSTNYTYLFLNMEFKF